MAKDRSNDATQDLKKEYNRQTGAAGGPADTVVDGKLDNIEGSSQRTYGSRNDSARAKLDDSTKRKG